jgi:GTP-binding protein
MEASFLKSAFNPRDYPPPDRPEIAFAGKSNVGKSSLINALVNRKNLARTSAMPGRTQALNFFCVENRLYLVDLPGYGFARVPRSVQESWGKMVETYLRTRPNLKAVVIILDIRREPGEGDADLFRWLSHYRIAAIPVLTKADKLSRQQARTRAAQITGQLLDLMSAFRPILFSARTSEGRAEIWEALKQVTRL